MTKPTVLAYNLEVMIQVVQHSTSKMFHPHKTSKLRSTELKPVKQVKSKIITATLHDAHSVAATDCSKVL